MKYFLPLLMVFASFANGCESSTDTSAPSRETQEKVTQKKSQEDAVDAIKKIGGYVTFDKSGKVIVVQFSGEKVTDADLVNLNGFRNLTRLNLSGTQVTDAGLVNLKNLTGLQALYLSHTKVNGNGLVNLKGLINLQNLSLGNTELTDTGLEHLKGLIGLQTLMINSTKVTDAGLVHLKNLTGLESLGLSNTKIKGSGLVHLKGMTSLKDLELADTQMTDAGLTHLKGMINLQYLRLGKTKITDAGLSHLKGLTGLKELDIWFTQITDVGLEHLKGLKNLKTLYLIETQVTEAGQDKFEAALPNCSLVRKRFKITAARIKECQPPSLKDFKSCNARYFDRDLKKYVEFAINREDWKSIRAALSPFKHDPNPAKWEGLGRLNITKQNGDPFHISLYSTGEGAGAFSAGKTFKKRIYFRGGKTSALTKALKMAYENSQKKKE